MPAWQAQMRLAVSEFGFLGIRVSLRLASVHTRLRSDARLRRLECGGGISIGFALLTRANYGRLLARARVRTSAHAGFMRGAVGAALPAEHVITGEHRWSMDVL
jgi:hypothetical protein